MAGRIETAAQLWRALQRRAGLDTNRYDSELFREIAESLKLPASIKAFEKGLVTAGVSIESLVDILLRVVRPYTGMTSDVLKMFEGAGARRSRDNIRMNFNFAASKGSLEFDLGNFREYERFWTVAERTVAVREWDSIAMWELTRALGGTYLSQRDKVNMPPDWRRWLDEYERDHSFPDWLPSRPEADGDAGFALEIAWGVFRAFFDSIRAHGRSHDQLRQARDDARNLLPATERDRVRSEPGETGPERTPAEAQAASLEDLAHIESDYWCGSFLVSLADFVTRSTDSTYATSVRENVGRIRERLPVTTKTVQERVEELFEILSLPVWKYRHALYATWVGARIVEALGAEKTTVHQREGEINFDFGGTHLATVEGTPKEQVFVWAELRSRHPNPIGKGRKSGIQPDYTLTRAPITDPRSSILVVECKQYQRAKAKNFNDALTDYTSGRPNANVILVSYGPTDSVDTGSLPRRLRPRAEIVGKFRPGEPEPLAAFRKRVASIVGGTKETVAGVPDDESDAVIRGAVTSLELVWQSAPRDLDLHLVGTDSSGGWTVNFQAKGSSLAAPWAELGDDVISGFGPEVIRFAPAFAGCFQCLVHNYSKESELAGSGASVVATIEGQTLEMKVPQAGSGAWWHVCDYDGGNRSLRVVNEVVAQLPGARAIQTLAGASAPSHERSSP